MSALRSRSSYPGYVVVAILAFMLGSATIVLGAVSGAVHIDAFRLADATNDTQLARVDASGNVAVSVSNTPTVSINGTPTVTVSRKPFQQEIRGINEGGEVCIDIVAPKDMRLTIESFSADVEGSPAPSVYLRTSVSREGRPFDLIRSVLLELHQFTGMGGDNFAGDVKTMLISGPGMDPDASTYSYSACTFAFATHATFRGLVTGYLEPLP